MIPVNPFPCNVDSVTLLFCGGSVVETRSGLEYLDDRESLITESVDADEGMSLGIGRLIIGKAGGGERPSGCGGCCSSRVWDSSNRRDAADGEGVPPP